MWFCNTKISLTGFFLHNYLIIKVFNSELTLRNNFVQLLIMAKTFQKQVVFLSHIVFCFALSGCSNTPPKTYTIGFSQCTMTDSWRKNMLEGMERELSFYPEITLLTKDATGNIQQHFCRSAICAAPNGKQDCENALVDRCSFC